MTRPLPTTRRGLTLLETLIALSITVITGMAIASVTTAVARGMTGLNTARSALQRAHAVHVRIRAYTDPALCVLDYDDKKGFAVWLDDSRTNDKVNLSELRVFWFSADDQTISVERVVFPDGWDPADYVKHDTTLSSVDDPFVMMEAQRDLGYTRTEVIADAVDTIAMEWPTNDIQDAGRVRLQLAVRADDDTIHELLIALGLPNHKAPA
jgi:hypothetical protein